MATKNGCNEASQLLLANGAFVEAKANVCFLDQLTFLGLICIQIMDNNSWFNLYSNHGYGGIVFEFPIVFYCHFCTEWNDSIAPSCLALTLS